MAVFFKPEFIISIGVSLVFHGLLFTSLITKTSVDSQSHSKLQRIKVKIVNNVKRKKQHKNPENSSQVFAFKNLNRNKYRKQTKILSRQAKNSTTSKKNKTQDEKSKDVIQKMSMLANDSKLIYNTNKNEKSVIYNSKIEQAKENYLSDLRTAISSSQYYPIRAQQMRIEGNLWVKFLIYKDGHIEQIIISKSSGKSVLDRAAKKSIIKFGNYQPFPDSINTEFLSVVLPIQFLID